MEPNSNPELPFSRESVATDNRKKFQFLVLDSQPATPQVGYMQQTNTGIILKTDWRPAEPRIHYVKHIPTKTMPFLWLAESMYGAE